MQATINGQRGKWVETEGREFGEGVWICDDKPFMVLAGKITLSPHAYKYVFLPDPPEAEPEPETLRDKFAIRILNGLLANPGGPIQANGMNGWNWTNCTIDQVTDTAYIVADSMMEARNNSPAKKG